MLTLDNLPMSLRSSEDGLQRTTVGEYGALTIEGWRSAKFDPEVGVLELDGRFTEAELIVLAFWSQAANTMLLGRPTSWAEVQLHGQVQTK